MFACWLWQACNSSLPIRILTSRRFSRACWRSHASRLRWRYCSSCIFGRKSGSFCCLLSSLRFLSCWGCSMGGLTAPGWLPARPFQNDSCSERLELGENMLRGMLKGKMKVERPLLLIAVGLAGLAMLAAPLPAFSQSCALCYTQAASAGGRMIQALRSGILILIVPPTLMSVGMIFIVHHKRNQVRREDDRPDSDRKW